MVQILKPQEAYPTKVDRWENVRRVGQYGAEEMMLVIDQDNIPTLEGLDREVGDDLSRVSLRCVKPCPSAECIDAFTLV